jgi:hypothetical protein
MAQNGLMCLVIVVMNGTLNLELTTIVLKLMSAWRWLLRRGTWLEEQAF